MPAGRPSEKAVYLLKDEHGNPRYVGVASDPDDRLKRHLRECRTGNTHRKAWVRSMIAAGHIPTMEVVEWTDDWDSSERLWVFKMRALGHRLTNGNEGGFDASQWAGKHSADVKTPYYKKMMCKLGLMFRPTKFVPLEPERVMRYQQAMDALRSAKKRWEKAGYLEIFELRMKLWYEIGYAAVKEFDCKFKSLEESAS